MIGCRISKQLWSLISELYHNDSGNAATAALYHQFVSSEKIDFLDIERAEGGGVIVSYLPANRVVRSGPGEWNYYSKKRQSARPGAALRKVLGEKIAEDDLRLLVEQLTARFLAEEFTIERRAGPELREWFHYENYYGSEGSELQKSCMRYDECQSWFGIYEHNPQLEMVAALRDGRVAARALIWRGLAGRRTGAGEDAWQANLVMMDRIYAATPAARAVLWRWGLRNVDLMHRIPRDLGQFFTIETGKVEHWELTQSLPGWRFARYPWIDTMSYYNLDRRVLANYPLGFDGNERIVKFHAGDGSYRRVTDSAPHYALADAPEEEFV